MEIHCHKLIHSKLKGCYLNSGGIEVNRQNPAEFLYHNLESQNNIIYSSWKFGVKKLLLIASSCIYPRECPQPMKEEYLLTGPLEPTSESYSVARIAGIRLCQNYRRQHNFNAITMVPAALYGPGDDMNEATAHVIGGLIGKFADALQNGKKEVRIWGTGNPRREFLYIDDFVAACLFLMDRYDEESIINVGIGKDVSIKELAELLAKVSGFQGKIAYDATKPDGTPQKLIDNARMSKLGWKPKIDLKEGLKRTYQWFTQSVLKETKV